MSAMPAWGDREIARFTFRVGLFQRRGLPPREAEKLADRLALRDYQRDDRRVCLECESIQRNGRCFKSSHGLMPGFSRFFEPLRTTLQRCASFTFQTP